MRKMLCETYEPEVVKEVENETAVEYFDSGREIKRKVFKKSTFKNLQYAAQNGYEEILLIGLKDGD